jgi:cell division protein FtsB
MAEVEQQKIIESLDRIINRSNDINDKLQKILDLIEERRILTTIYDGEVMFRHKREQLQSDIYSKIKNGKEQTGEQTPSNEKH